VEVILGVNGYIWVCKRASVAPEEMDPDALYADVNEVSMLSMMIIIDTHFVIGNLYTRT
jgi:exosome complex RNA-binding protein Rrp4